MASKPPPSDKTPKHKPLDNGLDRARREPKGGRLAGERGSLAQGVEIGSLSSGKTGGANLA